MVFKSQKALKKGISKPYNIKLFRVGVKAIASISAVQMIFSSCIFTVNATETNEKTTNISYSDTVGKLVDDLIDKQNDDYSWLNNNKDYTSDISDIFEYVFKNSEGLNSMEYEEIDTALLCSAEYFANKSYSYNTDDISKYMMLNELHSPDEKDILLSMQNDDGGFGLAEGYASDILDTKLALKALIDTGETEAMAKAAAYIISLQNEDGGFGYQPGLSSSPSLTAEIANILADTTGEYMMLDYYLENTFAGLDSYLDANCPALDKLSKSNTEQVCQNLNTALYRTKRTGGIDISPYYALQSDNGSVFDDPMSTALLLELIVRNDSGSEDKNNETAESKISAINITNDKGEATSVFIINENVNVTVEYKCDAVNEYVTMDIIEPDGTVIALRNDSVAMNTELAPEGEFTVRAKIVQKSDEKAVDTFEKTFRLQLTPSEETTTAAVTTETTSTAVTETTAATTTAAVTTETASTEGIYSLGDVNGDSIIDGRDATEVLTEYARTSTGKDPSFNEKQKAAADANTDNIIDGRDATLILTYYAYSSTGHTGSLEEYLVKS